MHVTVFTVKTAEDPSRDPDREDSGQGRRRPHLRPRRHVHFLGGGPGRTWVSDSGSYRWARGHRGSLMVAQTGREPYGPAALRRNRERRFPLGSRRSNGAVTEAGLNLEPVTLPDVGHLRTSRPDFHPGWITRPPNRAVSSTSAKIFLTCVSGCHYGVPHRKPAVTLVGFLFAAA